MRAKTASVHIDMDSPDTLLRFWGLDGGDGDLDQFYEVAMTRALRLLAECGIPGTFFCVGQDLERSPVAAALIRQAHREGHEIANHTQSHPFVLTALGPADVRAEIAECSAVIRRVTGQAPVGFRAPGYQVNTTVLDVLEELGFDYDSSAFWSVLHPLMRLYRRAVAGRSGPGDFGEAARGLPRDVYFPAREQWTRKGAVRAIVEVPLPRTRILNLPFYNNFHLAAGPLYRAAALASMHQPYLVYLVHLVEFTDLSDGLPVELSRHPNVRTETAVKVRALATTLRTLGRRYRIVKTADAVERFKAGVELSRSAH